MSRDKQIEEMADDLGYSFREHLDIDGHAYPNFDETAENLYAMGYRKASVGEWIDRYKGQFANPIYVCSVCDKGTLLTPHINELGQMEMVQAFSKFCPNCGAEMTNSGKKYESEGADDD